MTILLSFVQFVAVAWGGDTLMWYYRTVNPAPVILQHPHVTL